MTVLQQYVRLMRHVATIIKLTAQGKNSVQIYEETGLDEEYVSMIQSSILEGENYKEVIAEVANYEIGDSLISIMDAGEESWMEKAESSNSYYSEMEIAELKGKILGLIRYRFRENVELVRDVITSQVCPIHLKEWYVFAKRVCEFEDFSNAIQDPYYKLPAAYYDEEFEKFMAMIPKPKSQDAEGFEKSMAMIPKPMSQKEEPGFPILPESVVKEAEKYLQTIEKIKKILVSQMD